MKRTDTPPLPAASRDTWPRRTAALLVVLLTPGFASASNGRVCISSVPAATSGEKTLANATASESLFAFSIRIGDHAAVEPLRDRSIAVAGITADGTQMVAISRNGKPFASFTLQLSGYENDAACLWFDPLHETWRVEALNGSIGKCACPDT